MPSLFQSISNIFSSLKFVSHTADVCTLGQTGMSALGITGAAVTGIAAAPLLGVAAAYAVSMTMAEAYSRRKHHQQIDEVQTFLQEQVRKEGTLERALEELCRQQGQRMVEVPEGIRGEPLAALLAMIQGDQQEQLRRLESNHRTIEWVGTALHVNRRWFAKHFRFEAEQFDLMLQWVQGIDQTLGQLFADRTAPPLEIPVRAFGPGSAPAPGQEDQVLDVARFRFGARRTGLYGRDHELEILDTFLHDPRRRVAWRMITGAGGMGKSRIALELGVRHQDTWDFGTVELRGDRFAWERWLPGAPTLLVLDYIIGRYKDIAGMIATLIDRQSDYEHPVRVLLLEREADGQWWKQQTRAHGQDRTVDLEPARHGDPILLKPLNAAAAASVFRDVARRPRMGAVKPYTPTDEDAATFGDAFVSLDPKGRPLYAAIAAEAVVAGDHGINAVRAWSPKDLTESVLRREDARWRSIEPDMNRREQWLNVAVVTTLARGIRKSDLYTQARRLGQSMDGLIPSPHDFGTAQNFRDMFGPLKDGALPGLEPDLVGERFVIDRLSSLVVGDPDGAKALIQSAWHASPRATSVMCFMAKKDFENRIDRDTAALKLLEPPSRIIQAEAAFVAGNANEAINLWSNLISLHGTPADQVATAYSNRGVTYRQAGRADDAIADYTSIIGIEGAPLDLVAKAYYNRGVIYVEAGRIDDAIADYTSVIGIDGASTDQIAMAYNNRGFAHGLAGRDDDAIADYTSVTRIDGLSPDSVAAAYHNRGVTHGRAGRADEAIADYTSVIEIDGVHPDQMAMAYNSRGVRYGQAGRVDDEVADYTSVIGLDGASPDQVAEAHNNRGVRHGRAGRADDAIADYTSVIGIDTTSPDLVAKAYHNRGVTHGEAGRVGAEIADYTSVIGIDGASLSLVATAYNNRGVRHGQAGRTDDEIADYNSVIELKGSPPDQMAKAYKNRGMAHERAGRVNDAIADYTSIIRLDGSPLDQVIITYYNRGLAHGRAGRVNDEIVDYTSVIGLDGAPPDQVAKAYNNRGVRHRQAGRADDAIADYTSVIGLDGAPPDQVAKAYNNRGVAHGQAGRDDDAIADYTSVIGIDGAPPNQMATAYNNRGVAHGQAGRDDDAIADYTSVIGIDGAPPEQVTNAYYNRGMAHGQAGRDDDAIADYTSVIEFKGAIPDLVALAYNNRGVRHGQAGRADDAIADFTSLIGMNDIAMGKAPVYLLRAIAETNRGDQMQLHRIKDDAKMALKLGPSSKELTETANTLLRRVINTENDRD